MTALNHELRRYSFLAALFIIAILLSGTARAALVTGVTVSTDMGFFGVSLPERMVDGSGLTGELAAGTHAASTEVPANAWQSNVPNTSGNVTFDLGGLFTLDAFYVWNHSGNTDGSRGVNGVNVFTSVDGINFVALAGGPSSFAQQAASSAIPAQEFLFSSVQSTHVRFEILNNHNVGFGNVGLSEVQFSGISAVPLPAALPLFLSALAGLGLMGWRRRQAGA